MVIGVEDERARRGHARIYRPIERSGGPIVYTSRRSSEMIKYAANVFLAMKVTFINEIADLCERVGADVIDVSRGIGLDNRIGRKFLNPGPGFGGSCFPKDTLALTKLATDAKAPIRLVETLVDVNEKRKDGDGREGRHSLRRLGRRQADRRARPHLQAQDRRHARRAEPRDRAGAAGRGRSHRRLRSGGRSKTARPLLPGVEFAENAYACLEGADAAVIVTEWDEFRALDLARVKAALATPIIVDLRNIYPIKAMRALGFRYVCVGRGFGGEG